MASYELVIKVGSRPPMPWRRHSSTTERTWPTVRAGELKLVPWQPLICRSNSAGATHPASQSVGPVPAGAIAAIVPPSVRMSIRSPVP